MNSWRQIVRRFAEKADVARRKPTYRPRVEALEDRYVPSGDLSGFAQINLASDVPGLARVLDTNLVNAWGMSASPTGPFWVSDAGTGVSDLLDGRGDIVPLRVSVPGANGSMGTPTGTVFNGGPGFVVSANGQSASGQFLFATTDGTISAWAPAVDAANAIIAIDNSADGAVYLGLALAVDGNGHSYIYATDIAHGRIDVFDEQFHAVALAGSFVDPDLPRDFAPFNVQRIGDELFVTYIPVGNDHYPASTFGNGIVDVFAFDGTFVERFAAGGPLDDPWGITLAPADFGSLGGALLIGNNGDGRISAFNRQTGAFLGQLADDNGDPIANPNLWSISFGNDHMAGAALTLFFSAGYDDDLHGLFGAIQDPLHRGADTAGPFGFDPTFPGERSDYPLPPINGPTLVHTTRPQPEATLLPLSASSLALAPTLTTSIAATSAASAVPSAASVPSLTFVPVSFDPTSPSRLISSAMIIPPTVESVRSAAVEIRDNPASLSAFLDLNTGPNIAEIRPATMAPSPPAPSTGQNLLLTPDSAEPPPAPPQAPAVRLSQASLAAPDSVDVPPAPPVVSDAVIFEVKDEGSQHERGDWLKQARALFLIVGVAFLGACSLTWRRIQRPTAPMLARELAVTRPDIA
jgi:uncharacterized protein (TIGR03118 family)